MAGEARPMIRGGRRPTESRYPTPPASGPEGPLTGLSTRVPPDLLRRAKLFAVEHGTTVQQLVIDALEARLRD